MLSIRQATVTDLPAILSIVQQVVPLMHAAGNFQWEATYPNEQVFRADIEKGWLWVAELNEKVAGVAALTTAQDPEYAQADWDAAEPAVVTHRLAVDPAAQGQGIAAALLAQAEVLGRAWGLRVARIDTNSENRATQTLFPKLGYRFAGEINLAFRPGLRFFCYEKQITL
ncbi:GNAT family N-acetyltransferase [Hymenobacter sp. BT730]|uniref:GNAT family N-acetyltransferase n=1 Tax=Hymenobacter sp. BT730 TaxID=3063332 RepID=UPI0026DF77B0|nr:GNAT family N-acetyltransferase [Hymenobacter sp. BT730]